MTSNLVRLNVGGRYFDTTKETIQKSSFLKALVENETLTGGLVDGRHFIDRDPDAFGHILGLLRAADPTAYVFPDEYQKDLGFYCINLEPTMESELKEAERASLLEEITKIINNSRKDDQYCRTNGCYRERFEECAYCNEHGRFVDAERDSSWIQVGSYVETDKYRRAKVVSSDGFNNLRIVYWVNYNGELKWGPNTISVERNNCKLLEQVEA